MQALLFRVVGIWFSTAAGYIEEQVFIKIVFSIYRLRGPDYFLHEAKRVKHHADAIVSNSLLNP